MTLRSLLPNRLLLAAALLFGGAAHGAALTASEVLAQFNLVSLGNVTTTSHVDGRAYVGGTLSGSNAVFGMHPESTPASAYSALTVAGTATGSQITANGLTALGNVQNITVNNGAAVVAGNATNSSFNGSGGSRVYGSSSGVNANSGSLSQAAASALLATAVSTDFASVLGAASDSLRQLASTGSTWTISGNRVTFHAVANASGLAVFDLSAVDETLLAMAEFDFDYGNATSVIFNSDLLSATINANFINNTATAIASKTIWNFYNATSLTLGTAFGGSVLATDAALTNYNNIEGGVYVASLTQQGEIHQGAYTGTIPPGGSVPEPASLALVLLAGLAGVASTAKGRRKA